MVNPDGSALFAVDIGASQASKERELESVESLGWSMVLVRGTRARGIGNLTISVGSENQ